MYGFCPEVLPEDLLGQGSNKHTRVEYNFDGLVYCASWVTYFKTKEKS